MIKVITYLTKAIVTFITTLLFVACGFERMDGNGNVTTQQRDVSQDFTSVSAGNGLKVEIIQGNRQSVTVEADENLQEHIITEVNGGELEIKTDVNIGTAIEKKVTVHIKEVKAIDASSGVSLKAPMIKSDNIAVTVSSGSHADITIEANDAKCEASSGSHLEIKGTAQNLTTDSSSGSTLDAGNLKANNITAKSSSGASSIVNPDSKLDAKASSGGNIKYKNTPSKLNSNTSSGGSVSQQ